MKPYLFEYQQKENHLRVTEYIYEIGTFHYNWHKDMELLVVLKGEVEVCAGNHLYLLDEDDMILINSNEGHATFAKSPGSIAFLLRMNPDFLEQYLPDYRYRRFVLCTDADSRNQSSCIQIRRYMAEMMTACMKEDGNDELLFRSAFYGLLNLLVRQFSQKTEKTMLGQDKRAADIPQIIGYMEDHYKEKLSLDEVAEYFGYNSSYFSQMFRNSVGINFYEFLTRRRLREAVRELDRTDKKILDISNDTGFPNLKSFNTRFKELFGRTPKKYRSSLETVRVRDSENYVQAYIEAGNLEVERKLVNYQTEIKCENKKTAEISGNSAMAVRQERDEKIRRITERLESLAREVEELNKFL